MTVISYLPATGSVDDHWPNGFVTEADRNRFQRYAEAAGFYDGAQWSARRRPGELRLTFNYARALVRKVASYVFPAPVSFSVIYDGDQGVANRAEQRLAEVIAD